MSWYNFSGPVQGGYGPMGAEDDEKRRRRRDAYRDAGSPYAGGASGGGIIPYQQDQPQHPASGPFAGGEQGGQAGYDAWGSGAPRQAAAVDMGHGAMQPQFAPGQLQFEPVLATAVHEQQHIGGPGYTAADTEEKLDAFTPGGGDASGSRAAEHTAAARPTRRGGCRSLDAP